jgi:membrane protease YdiL (CAAX protease family)
LNADEKFFSKIGVNYLIFGALALIFQIIIVNILHYSGYNLLTDINSIAIFTSICNYILPLPVFIYLMRKIQTYELEHKKPGILRFVKYVAITLTLMWAGNIFGLIVTALLGGAMNMEISNPVNELINSSDILLNILLISIIGPIFEEVIFRKFLIDRTIKYGARVSIILSAVIFGFFHGNLNQFFYAFLIGGFFAYVYIRTGNILYSIALHIITNVMGSIVSLFVASSTTAIMQGSYATSDMILLAVYLIIVLGCLLVGVFSLINYRNARFNGSKTKIALKKPLKTVLLNPGMICFMLFFIGEIVYQMIH